MTESKKLKKRKIDKKTLNEIVHCTYETLNLFGFI